MPGYTNKGPSSTSSSKEGHLSQPAGINKYNTAILSHISHPASNGYPVLGEDGSLVWFSYDGIVMPAPASTFSGKSNTSSRESRRQNIRQEPEPFRLNALDFSAIELCARACKYTARRGDGCEGAVVDRIYGDFICSAVGGIQELPVELRFK